MAGVSATEIKTRTETRTSTAKRRVAGVLLSPSEWNFKGLPDNQREACYLYEYGREFFRSSRQLQKVSSEWKKRKSQSFGFDGLEKTMKLLRTKCPNFPNVQFKYFPDVAWQDLAEDWPFAKMKVNLRQRLADEVNEWSRRRRENPSDRIHIETVGQCAPANIGTLEAFQRYHKFFHETLEGQDLSGTEYGFFAVNWKQSDKQISNAIQQWLRNQRDERKKLGLADKSAGGNRGGLSDKLNWLGALRVKNHYWHGELIDHADTNLKVGAPYSHYPDLCAAANKAKEEISKLFSEEWDEAEWQHKQGQKPKQIAKLPDFLK